MCMYVEQNKVCYYGHTCMFAHTPEQLRSVGDPLPPVVYHPTLGSPQFLSQSNVSAPRADHRVYGVAPDSDMLQVWTNPPRLWRTKMCSHRQCYYGHTCQFAHTREQLRFPHDPLPPVVYYPKRGEPEEPPPPPSKPTQSMDKNDAWESPPMKPEPRPNWELVWEEQQAILQALSESKHQKELEDTRVAYVPEPEQTPTVPPSVILKSVEGVLAPRQMDNLINYFSKISIKNATGTAPMSSWECGSCVYTNPPDAPTCEFCAHPRPQSIF